MFKSKLRPSVDLAVGENDVTTLSLIFPICKGEIIKYLPHRVIVRINELIYVKCLISYLALRIDVVILQ